MNILKKIFSCFIVIEKEVTCKACNDHGYIDVTWKDATVSMTCSCCQGLSNPTTLDKNKIN